MKYRIESHTSQDGKKSFQAQICFESSGSDCINFNLDRWSNLIKTEDGRFIIGLIAQRFKTTLKPKKIIKEHSSMFVGCAINKSKNKNNDKTCKYEYINID